MWHLLTGAVWLLFLVGWYTIYYYAAQPKQGTLEWINMYDRQPFSCLSARETLVWQDLAWAVGCTVAAGGAWAWHLNQLLPLGLYPLRDLLQWGVMPALGAGGIYLLARLLGCRRTVCVLGACCCAVCFAMAAGAGPGILAMALFYGWMSQSADAGFVKNALWLVSSWICTGMAVILTPAAWWLIPFYGLLWLFVVALRWRQGYGWGKILVNGLLCLLLLVGMGLVFLVSWSVQPAGLAWADFPAAIWNGALGQTLTQLRPDLLQQLVRLPDRAWLDLLLDNSVVVLAGVFAFVTLVLRGSAGTVYALLCWQS